jgi:hypothetical protein
MVNKVNYMLKEPVAGQGQSQGLAVAISQWLVANATNFETNDQVVQILTRFNAKMVDAQAQEANNESSSNAESKRESVGIQSLGEFDGNNILTLAECFNDQVTMGLSSLGEQDREQLSDELYDEVRFAFNPQNKARDNEIAALPFIQEKMEALHKEGQGEDGLKEWWGKEGFDKYISQLRVGGQGRSPEVGPLAMSLYCRICLGQELYVHEIKSKQSWRQVSESNANVELGGNKLGITLQHGRAGYQALVTATDSASLGGIELEDVATFAAALETEKKHYSTTIDKFGEKSTDESSFLEDCCYTFGESYPQNRSYSLVGAGGVQLRRKQTENNTILHQFDFGKMNEGSENMRPCMADQLQQLARLCYLEHKKECKIDGGELPLTVKKVTPPEQEAVMIELLLKEGFTEVTVESKAKGQKPMSYQLDDNGKVVEKGADSSNPAVNPQAEEEGITVGPGNSSP